MDPSFKWIKTTAEYLNGNVHEFHRQEGGPEDADVQLARNVSYGSFSEFMTFFVTAPEICRILVPRGRPLNAVELMVMPFSWHVWTLLLFVLSLAEAVRHVWPELFKNDPILLAVCGFERHNLHEAGRWEKIFLHSLIILMFLMKNAFETKIISLMVDKPSLQTATKLEDFDKYGLKFRYNLSEHPQSVNHTVIGKYVVHERRHKPNSNMVKRSKARLGPPTKGNANVACNERCLAGDTTFEKLILPNVGISRNAALHKIN
ncbi:hypothetical protein pipiens_005863 [Culex pipiens pipiens]|uniref:Uncharacterized protein n=1 Tax=Culex pipiens pipiens TaxID=38569 RepID=A0ABD1DT52_CULPP